MDDNSILDRVLSSKQVSDIENFNPSETLSALLKELTTKEAETLSSRFGLRGQPEQTLEEIGRRFAVTRERVRQIEDSAITKLKTFRRFNDIMHPTEELIREVLEMHGGASTEKNLLQELFRDLVPSESDRRAVLFFLHELLADRFDRIGKAEKLHDGWKLRGVLLVHIQEMIEHILSVFRTKRSPMNGEALYTALQGLPYFEAHPEKLTESSLVSYLALSPQIGKNPYQEYGLVTWGTIAPKRMNDKIYLILHRHGKPLHFSEITRMINETGFDRRIAYPPTVHNELILNKQYVLVGRGIYALREWGYKPGVVADVLQEILLQANEPLTREQLVAKVLEQRLVKKNTIHLALADAKRFTKLPDDRYFIAKSAINENVANINTPQPPVTQ